MKFTKKKDPKGWRVFADGRDTGLTITKGDAPKFGQRQEWWVERDGDPASLFCKYAVGDCMGVIMTLCEVFLPQASPYEVRRGTGNGELGIFSRSFNVRIATFAPGTEKDAHAIGAILDGAP